MYHCNNISCFFELISATPQTDLPITPLTLTVATVFSNNVTLMWNHIYCPSYQCGENGVQNYQISTKKKYDSSWHYITVPVPEGTNVGAILNSTVTVLVPSSTYTFRVEAINDISGAHFSYSERVTTRTLAPNSK